MYKLYKYPILIGGNVHTRMMERHLQSLDLRGEYGGYVSIPEETRLQDLQMALNNEPEREGHEGFCNWHRGRVGVRAVTGVINRWIRRIMDADPLQYAPHVFEPNNDYPLVKPAASLLPKLEPYTALTDVAAADEQQWFQEVKLLECAAESLVNWSDLQGRMSYGWRVGKSDIKAYCEYNIAIDRAWEWVTTHPPHDELTLTSYTKFMDLIKNIEKKQEIIGKKVLQTVTSKYQDLINRGLVEQVNESHIESIAIDLEDAMRDRRIARYDWAKDHLIRADIQRKTDGSKAQSIYDDMCYRLDKYLMGGPPPDQYMYKFNVLLDMARTVFPEKAVDPANGGIVNLHLIFNKLELKYNNTHVYGRDAVKMELITKIVMAFKILAGPKRLDHVSSSSGRFYDIFENPDITTASALYEKITSIVDEMHRADEAALKAAAQAAPITTTLQSGYNMLKDAGTWIYDSGRGNIR